MPEHREYDDNDIFYASTVRALMEYVSGLVVGLRLTVTADATLHAEANSDDDQVSIGVDGKWRYRTTDFDLAISGAAATYDIYVTASANDFTGGGNDPDATDYNWSLAQVALAGTPAGVDHYRGPIARIDFDGTKITGLRQLVGVGDSTFPLTPTSARAALVPLRAIGASGQTAPLQTWETSAGAVKGQVDASGNLQMDGNATFDGSDGVVISGGSGKDTLALTSTGTDTGVTFGGDTNLYRDDASLLKTDDDFDIGGDLRHQGDALGFFGEPKVTLADADGDGWGAITNPSRKSLSAGFTMNELEERGRTVMFVLQAYGLLAEA